LFYYGSVDQVVQALNHDNIHNQNIHLWYDPAAVWTSSSSAPPASFVAFEGRSAVQPGTYQARIFPQYIDSLRSDGIRTGMPSCCGDSRFTKTSPSASRAIF